ncbi:hypothetical protein ADUPG1_001726, partial [Aduncisulcus paluster]
MGLGVRSTLMKSLCNCQRACSEVHDHAVVGQFDIQPLKEAGKTVQVPRQEVTQVCVKAARITHVIVGQVGTFSGQVTGEIADGVLKFVA